MIPIAIAAVIAFTQVRGKPMSLLQVAAHMFNGDYKEDDFLQGMRRTEAIKAFGPLLKSEKPDTSGYIVAAFALAIDGVDVPANLARIIGPLKNAQGQLEGITESGGLAKDEILPEDIPTAVYALYRIRHNQPALKALFTTPIDGAVAENRDDDVMDALSHSPTDLIRLAAQNESIYSKLWDIADWNVGRRADRADLIHRLRATRWPNPAIHHTAMRLANDLRTPKHRPS